MATVVANNAHFIGLRPASPSRPARSRKQRILTALGLNSNCLPRVDDTTLLQYYRYLSTHLSLPCEASYFEAAPADQPREFHCAVVELLDPRSCPAHELDGIFCKARIKRFEFDVPLIELKLPEDSPNFRLIDDFWYWFWNWR